MDATRANSAAGQQPLKIGQLIYYRQAVHLHGGGYRLARYSLGLVEPNRLVDLLKD